MTLHDNLLPAVTSFLWLVICVFACLLACLLVCFFLVTRKPTDKKHARESLLQRPCCEHLQKRCGRGIKLICSLAWVYVLMTKVCVVAVPF